MGWGKKAIDIFRVSDVPTSKIPVLWFGLLIEKTLGSGAPGWLSWLSIQLLVLAQVKTSGWWDRAQHQAPCWAWNLLEIQKLLEKKQYSLMPQALWEPQLNRLNFLSRHLSLSLLVYPISGKEMKWVKWKKSLRVQLILLKIYQKIRWDSIPRHRRQGRGWV